MKITRVDSNIEYMAGILTSEYIDEELYTLERPWQAAEHWLGGRNERSCVPNGHYLLTPFKRPKNGLIVPQLTNPDLGVYALEDDLPPEGGRFLILMHPGNLIKDIIGCIACGTWKKDPYSVNDSRDAQMHLMQAFNEGDKELIIESFDTKEIYVPGAD